MPRVVPSQVVELIKRAFPATDDAAKFNPVLNAQHAPLVGPVLAMYDLIPEKHFRSLSPEDDILHTTAGQIIRTYLELWKYLDGNEKRLTGGPAMTKQQVLRERHPIEVLRAILEKCPDDPPDTTAGRLQFLGAPLEETVGQDVALAFSTYANGEFKAACIFAGAAVEALLLWAVLRKKASDISAAIAACKAKGERTPAKSKPEEWDLIDLLNVGHRIPVIEDETFDAANQARDYRNMIHPGVVQRSSIKPTKARALLALGAAERTIDDLASRIAAGTL